MRRLTYLLPMYPSAQSRWRLLHVLVRGHCAFATGVEGALRLTDTVAGVSADVQSGILEIFHAGAWGTICLGPSTYIMVCCWRCIILTSACYFVHLPVEVDGRKLC